ncbi:hypothetical protein PWT90_03926 [Aphanocladium album]|nr:hypothetical protein PWT90_03926 [Aphanocladium album]
MSYLSRSIDGAGSSDSSGDATPTPRTPTNEVFPPNGDLTPSPHHSNSRRFFAQGDDASRQSRRNIWEDANRPPPNTLPHVVFPESPSNPRNGAINTQPKAAAPHTQSSFVLGTPVHSRMERSEPDANDWYAGLEMLQLQDPVLRASSDVPRPRQQSSFFYNTREPTAVQPAFQPTTQAPRMSMWSTYGNQTPSKSTPRNNGDVLMESPFAPLSAPRPSRADPTPGLRSRALSDTNYSATTDLPQAQRRFASQPNPAIPMRMGQSQQYGNRHHQSSSASEAYQPEPFYLQPRNQGFLPMHAIRTGREPSIPTQPLGFSVANPVPSTRFSDRYHGMHTESNASAEHLTPEENASLWVTNLPPDITHHELLGQIRYIGRIWCCFINGPDGMKHTTAAAKIVFFRPSAAQRMLQHSIVEGLKIRGFRAKVTQNRIKTGETIARGDDDSRVLIVTGQTHFVNERTLTEYFTQRFVFQLDEVKELIKGGGRAVLEFRFGSYRCQAQMGKISLEKDRPLGFEKAEFGEDPCEVGETFSSHAIALQRIKGIGI